MFNLLKAYHWLFFLQKIDRFFCKFYLSCIMSIPNTMLNFIKTKCIFFAVFFYIAFFNSDNAMAAAVGCGDDANPAIKTICDIIMFLQGRIARALVAFSIMLAAWSFVGGNFKWQEMVTLAIGIGIFYAPKTFALFLLPEYIQGITGDGYDVGIKYTPDEIITCACPNLR